MGGPYRLGNPGSHVDLILDRAATKQYSLCGEVGDRHSWRLGILRDPNGSCGWLYVHDQLQVGDVVRVRGPRNNFPLVASPRDLVAGGIGITPILPMVRVVEAAKADWQLVYGGRQRASMAFLTTSSLRRQDHDLATRRKGTARSRWIAWKAAARYQGLLLRTRGVVERGRAALLVVVRRARCTSSASFQSR